MPKEIVHLIFPSEQIKKPVIDSMSKKYDIVSNIRRAKVTETVGEVTLEISGTKENLEKARKYLEKNKIKVKPITGDIIE